MTQGVGSVSNQQFASQAIQNGNRPAPQEGPRAIPLNLDFTTATGNTSILLDLKQAQAMAHVQYIQTVYVDNSGSSGPTNFNVQGLNQNVTIPGGYQAYIPILAINPPVLVVSNNSNVRVPIQLLNFPLPPCVWPAAGGVPTFNPSGYLQVSDPLLDALIGNWNGFGNALAVADLGLQSLISGGKLQVSGGGGGLNAANLAVSGNTGIGNTTLVAGVAAKTITVIGADFWTEPGAFSSNAAGDNIQFALVDIAGGVTFATANLGVPGAAPAAFQLGNVGFHLDDINYALPVAGGLRLTTQTAKGSGITFTGPNPGAGYNVRYLQQ